jgi:hypothetical protein
VKEGDDASGADSQLRHDMNYTSWLAGESQTLNDVDELLLCNEIIDSPIISNDFGLSSRPSDTISHNTNDLRQGVDNPKGGIAELENLELDTPPEFQLSVSILSTCYWDCITCLDVCFIGMH